MEIGLGIGVLGILMIGCTAAVCLCLDGKIPDVLAEIRDELRRINK